MTTEEQILEIRFTGSDVIPGSVRSKEIAQIIQAIEEMVAVLIVDEHHDILKEGIVVGLSGVEQGSLRLQFRASQPNLAFPAWITISEAVTSNQYGRLPTGAIDSLRIISNFIQQKRCSAEFVVVEDKPRILATLTPDQEITNIPFINGFTTIYGMIIRVGGQTPKALIRTIEGELVSCNAEVQLAKILGSKLYSTVGLYGSVKWNSNNYRIEQFFIERILDFEESSLFTSFEDIAKDFGKHFEDIDDVKNFVTDLRDETMET